MRVAVVVALLVCLALAQRVELAAVAQAASTYQHKRLLELLIRAVAVVLEQEQAHHQVILGQPAAAGLLSFC
jgi:hypothetical protein